MIPTPMGGYRFAMDENGNVYHCDKLIKDGKPCFRQAEEVSAEKILKCWGDNPKFEEFCTFKDGLIFVSGREIGIVIENGKRLFWKQNQQKRMELIKAHSVEEFDKAQKVGDKTLVPLFFRGEFAGLNVYENGILQSYKVWLFGGKNCGRKTFLSKHGWKDKKK